MYRHFHRRRLVTLEHHASHIQAYTNNPGQRGEAGASLPRSVMDMNPHALHALSDAVYDSSATTTLRGEKRDSHEPLYSDMWILDYVYRRHNNATYHPSIRILVDSLLGTLYHPYPWIQAEIPIAIPAPMAPC